MLLTLLAWPHLSCPLMLHHLSSPTPHTISTTEISPATRSHSAAAATNRLPELLPSPPILSHTAFPSRVLSIRLEIWMQSIVDMLLTRYFYNFYLLTVTMDRFYTVIISLSIIIQQTFLFLTFRSHSCIREHYASRPPDLAHYHCSFPWPITAEHNFMW